MLPGPTQSPQSQHSPQRAGTISGSMLDDIQTTCSLSQMLTLTDLPTEVLRMIIILVPTDTCSPEKLLILRLVCRKFSVILDVNSRNLIFECVGERLMPVENTIMRSHFGDYTFKVLKSIYTYRQSASTMTLFIKGRMGMLNLIKESMGWAKILYQGLMLWMRLHIIFEKHGLEKTGTGMVQRVTNYSIFAATDLHLLFRYVSVRLAYSAPFPSEIALSMEYNMDTNTMQPVLRVDDLYNLSTTFEYSLLSLSKMVDIMDRINEFDWSMKPPVWFLAPLLQNGVIVVPFNRYIISIDNAPVTISVKSWLCEPANIQTDDILQTSFARVIQLLVKRLLETEGIESDDSMLQYLLSHKALTNNPSQNHWDLYLLDRELQRNPATVNRNEVRMALMRSDFETILDADLCRADSKLRQSMRSLDDIVETAVTQLEEIDVKLQHENQETSVSSL